MAELRTIGGTQRVLPPELVEALSARFGDRFHVGEAMRLEHGKSETHFAPMPPDAVVFAESTDDVVALVVLTTLRFHPTLSYRARAIGVTVLPYVVGTWFLFEIGWVSHIYLMAVPVIGALLLGLRPALVSLAVVVDAMTSGAAADPASATEFGDPNTGPSSAKPI